MTPEGVRVVGGVFRFVDEQGIPLDLVVDRLRDRGLMVDWLAFLREAEEAGWPRERTVRRLREAVGDVYGPLWAAEWEKRAAG